MTSLIFRIYYRLRLPFTDHQTTHFFSTTTSTTTTTSTSSTMGLFGTSDPVKKEEKLINQGESPQ